MSPIIKINFKNATKQSLGSFTASLFTPNRIGEYGAKAIFYTKGLRKQILLANLLSNGLQMSITAILGTIGLYFFIKEYSIDINYSNFIYGLISGLLILVIMFFLIRKNVSKTKAILFKKIIDFLSHFPKKIIFYGFIFSLLRYLIFSFQFYLLLTIFGTEVGYLNAFKTITSMYLLASIVPTISILDIAIKGSVAVYLFSFLEINEVTVLAIVTIMWLFNFVLPSFLGSYYVLRFNFPKTPVQV
ncbi:hypothetical protein [Pseudalgibacter alginicilyticus]|uniref:hypothetical protein n=1 Tax=Pseudalgibacter alginicilyticus TaxID=1736674 RepID=UPI003D796F11